MSESKKEKLWRRACAYSAATTVDSEEQDEAAYSWQDGYKACMSDLRKLIGQQDEADHLVREFLKPMR